MSRISVKLGDLEIDYEGDQKFITDGLLNFAKEFVAAAGANVAASSASGVKRERNGAVALSTSSIAQKLGSKSGSVSCTRFRRHRVRCFMEQEVCHGETSVYARVQA
jgi:hypothetical protein